MKVTRIHAQNQLEGLLEKLDWSHAFIREAFILSPSYVHSENLAVIAPDSNASMKLIVSFQDKDIPGLELFFEDVQEIYFSFQLSLKPIGLVNNKEGNIQLRMHGKKFAAIEAKSLSYALLDESSWGWKTRYGMNNLFDKGGFSIPIDLS